MKKKLAGILCALCLLMVTMPKSSAAWTNPYSDLNDSDWYYSYVSDLSASGVVNGLPDGTFSGAKTVTFGEALKLILLATGYPQQQATGSNWASGYLEFAIQNGFVSASDVPDLNGTISRQRIARLAALAKGLTEKEEDSPYEDTSDGYVLALYDAGIMEGVVEGEQRFFQPEESITRAEMSAVVWRLYNVETTDVDDPEQGTEIPEETEVDGQETITYKDYTLVVDESLPKNTYDPDQFVLDENGFMTYDSEDYDTTIGIDVSSYQGDIDWEAVKNSGVQFVIIRVGFRGYGSAGNMVEDTNFKKNLQGAMDAGLPVGVYFFSQAITVDEAIEEADFVLDRIQGYDLTYPVVFDWEPLGREDTRTYGLKTEILCEAANAFCQKVQDAGYLPMIYFNTYAGYIKYDLGEVKDYDFWFAMYSDAPTFYYSFDMWQYSSKGTVDGITGNVDMDLCFKHYE